MKSLTLKEVRARSRKTSTGCWCWEGACVGGYGVARHEGRNVRVHRWVLEQMVGPLGERLALHRCDHRWCVNPTHLYAGTAAENARDVIARFKGRTQHVAVVHSRKTHCKHGHRFTKQNTRVTTRGGRVCLTCKRADDAARRRAAGQSIRGEYTKRDRARINPDANANGALLSQSPA